MSRGDSDADNSLLIWSHATTPPLIFSALPTQILVLSGKGGVGKSTFSAQLAFNLAEQGKEVRRQLRNGALSLRSGAFFDSTAAHRAHVTTQSRLLAQVGLLDIDICGPSVPKMMGLEGEEIHQSGSGWSPVYVQPNLAVMSIGFLLTDPNDAVVWRGPRKSGLIKQFLKDVDWGSLDYLVRAPPAHSRWNATAYT